MDPTVTAAAVGVGGTVLVGVAGFGAAIWNTRRTIAHARESRVWDRRADVYVEALASMQYRQLSSRDMTLPDSIDGLHLHIALKQTKDLLAEYKPPDLQGLEARVQAFASQPVLTAMQASNAAHRAAIDAFKFKMEKPLPSPERVRAGVVEAWKAAMAADYAVVEAIRTELQGRGLPLGDWQPEPVTAPGPAPEAPGETGTAGTTTS
jgi:hypothetical protein